MMPPPNESYCEDVNNIEECLAFAERHNMLPKEELKEARQVAKALREGAELPGGCTSKQSCETYCEDGAHIEECIAFAEKAGFIDDDELEEIQKILPLMKSGQMPGGCTSKDQCEEYCEDDSHIIECVAFAEKAGFMSPQEAEMARKTGGRGPGGCRRDECDAYCENPDNQDACFEFAKEHGLISEEDLAQMKEGSKRIREGLQHANEEVRACLKREVGPNIVDEIENGTFSPSRRSGEAIKECFEKHMDRPEFPPEVEKCMIEIYGDDAIDKIMSGEIDNSEIEKEIGPCVSELMKEKFGDRQDFGNDDHDGDDFGRETFEGEFGGFGGEHGDEEFREEHREQFEREFDRERERIEHEIRGEFEDDGFDRRGDDREPSIQLNFPPQADECFVKLYGRDYKDKIVSGEINPDRAQELILKCMEGNMELQKLQSSSVFEAVRQFLR